MTITITKEDLILKELSNVSADIKDLKKESKSHGETLVRLESTVSAQQTQCKLLHIAVDRRLDNLEDFEEKTGSTNIAELKSKNDKIADWHTWGARLLLAIPVSILTAGLVLLIKGCGG